MRDTGIGIYDPLFFIGVVENNVDERLEGRVQVRAFGVHGTVDQVPTESLPWATLIHGSYDPNAMLPPLNSFVFGFFIDGRDAQQPMILGLIPTQMTELIDPAITGWGRIPPRDAAILSCGSAPEDFGQPANSRLVRGENIDETYVLTQEMNRIKNVPISTDGLTERNETFFEEPAPAYNAQYPYNRVIETATHSIELDDTPGAERIMIRHNSGSYISIDSRGTTVQKSKFDKYEINDSHQHVYVGGKSYVTIMGDSHVLVKGNKIEEIEGDYTQIVRGNHMISVAGQMNLNASEEVQMRAAKLRIHANSENVNIKAKRGVRIYSETESTHIKSGSFIYQEANNSINIKANENIYIEATETGNIKAKTVNIDDIINLANGDAASATISIGAESTQLPEPAQKSISTTSYRNTSSTGSSGYVSRDNRSSNSSTNRGDNSVSSTALTNAEVDKILSGEEPALARAEAEKFLGKPLSDVEWNNLVAATVAESAPNSPQEQAAVMAVILNRVKSSSYPNTVLGVLQQSNQFQAVTGTRFDRTPSPNFTNPPNSQIASTISGANKFLGNMDQGWLNFTANSSAAYGPGTNIGFRDDVTSSTGSQVIGGTVFGTVG